MEWLIPQITEERQKFRIALKGSVFYIKVVYQEISYLIENSFCHGFCQEAKIRYFQELLHKETVAKL